MRRRDTRCKQWKRVHDVPLSSLVVCHLCLPFIISLFIFCSALLFLFLLFSLSLVNIYTCIRSHILSLSLSHLLPLTPLFFSFASCFVLSSSLFPSHTSEKYSGGSSRSSSGSSSSQIRERARKRERERWKKSERNVERENDRRGERGRTEQVPARGGWGCRRARGSDLESGGVGGKGMVARREGKERGDGRTGILSSNGVAANHRTWAQP